jgi:hypothetical protein
MVSALKASLLSPKKVMLGRKSIVVSLGSKKLSPNPKVIGLPSCRE